MLIDPLIAAQFATQVTTQLAPPADALVAVTHPDPYPYYRELAARPFHHDAGLRMWVAASPADVAAVLANPACRVRPVNHRIPPPLAGSDAGELFARFIRMNDGDAHLPMKRAMRGAMAALDLSTVGRQVHALAERLDYDASPVTVDRWVVALPVLTVAALLGLPLDDASTADAVATHVHAYAAAMSPLADADEHAAASGAARYLGEMMATAMSSPSPFLAALHREAEGQGIVGATIAANAIGLMIQACDATAGLCGNTLLRLGRSGALAGGDTLERVIADTLRDDPPVQNTRRFLADDADLCGERVQAGDTVLVLLAAAGTVGVPREVRHGQAPDLPAWTFGRGTHACPGDALAATLACETVRALLARGVDPEALARHFRYRPSQNARIPRFR